MGVFIQIYNYFYYATFSRAGFWQSAVNGATSRVARTSTFFSELCILELQPTSKPGSVKEKDFSVWDQ
jgi:hypothetical protein